LAYVETDGGVRVSENDLVVVGKNDVSIVLHISGRWANFADPLFQGWKSLSVLAGYL
jgi:hypothetical protein